MRWLNILRWLSLLATVVTLPIGLTFVLCPVWNMYGILVAVFVGTAPVLLLPIDGLYSATAFLVLLGPNFFWTVFASLALDCWLFGSCLDG